MVRSAPRQSAPEGTISQEIKFTPPPPAEIRDPEEPLSFWEQLFEVQEDQWAGEGEKGFKVYLYEGQSGGRYIALVTQPFDVEWVKQEYGGGSYRAQLNNPGGKIVASARFTVEGESRRKPPQSAQAAPAVAGPSHDPFTQVLEIMRDGQRRQEQLLQQLIDSRGANPAPVAPIPTIDPNVALKGVVEIFSGLVARAASPPPQMGLLEMVALIEKFKGPDLLTVLTQAKAAGLIPSAGAGGNLVTQFKELKEAAEVVGLGDGGKSKSWAETLVEKGPEILEAGSRLIGNYKEVEEKRLATATAIRDIQRDGRAIQQAGPQAPSPAIHPPALANTPSPAQTYTAPPPITGSTLEVESPTAAQPLSAEAAQAKAQQQSDFIKNKVVEMIAGQETGSEIVDFLDAVDSTICDRFANHSAAEIGMWFANDAILKKAVTLPRFKAVIAEMVEEINTGEPEPPPQVN